MPVLDDLLQKGLKVVFCGSAVGTASARAGAYYAGPGNKFWGILAQTGLTPRKLTPAEFPELLNYSIGLTDLAKKSSGSDSEIPLSGYDAVSLRSKIKDCSPGALAFNGKRPARVFLGRPVDYGMQPDERIGNTVIFVLPSTSAAARRYWDEKQWVALADFIGKIA